MNGSPVNAMPRMGSDTHEWRWKGGRGDPGRRCTASIVAYRGNEGRGQEAKEVATGHGVADDGILLACMAGGPDSATGGPVSRADQELC